MSYIGNQPYQIAFVTDTFSGNASTTAFTMSVAPANTSSVLVAITGVLQDPSTYSVSGTTLTFSAAPPTGTGNISVRYLGIPASGVTTTAYRTVTDFTATAGQTTFTPPSYTVGFINVYRNGSRLGSADYTATNGTTVVLASAASSGDLVTVESFLVSSVLNAIPATAASISQTYLASGVAGTGPAFSAYGSGVQSLANTTATKIQFNTKLYDTNTNFDTTNYRFTPTVGGYYQINVGLYFQSSAAGQGVIYFYKNGSQFTLPVASNLFNGAANQLFGSTLMYLNGSGDYAEVYGYQSSGGSLNVGSGGTNQLFSGALVRSA